MLQLGSWTEGKTKDIPGRKWACGIIFNGTLIKALACMGN